MSNFINCCEYLNCKKLIEKPLFLCRKHWLLVPKNMRAVLIANRAAYMRYVLEEQAIKLYIKGIR